MQLEKINKTNDVKKISKKDKIILSDEIRKFMLDNVSKTGGHIASNLGVVELTIALESVFDLNEDKIIWDVGHQCYPHKILNGRKDKLKTIRQFNGISGFPKYDESITDCFNTGHSSTSISAAMGLAKARDLQHKKYNVIAVIGDGALTGGMALEALNHVGSSNTKLIVILNDNEMSISKNIGGINKLLTNLRIRKKYNQSNIYGKKYLSKVPFVGNVFVRYISKLKDGIKQLLIPGMYFEEIGFRYLGPVDGHDISNLEEIFRHVKVLDGPTIIHVVTKKGKGYLPAENEPNKFHGIGAFNVETGELLKEKQIDYSEIFGNKLIDLAKKDKKIVAITAAMKSGTGLSDFAKRFPDRFFDVGIAEQHALTFAAGLARGGLKPFVSIYSSFYQRCYDQVIHDICLQKLSVIMCVDRAGIVGNDGDTHQGLYDLSFFNLVPNLVIMAPKNFSELEMMMDFAIVLDRPVVIRYPRGSENKLEVKDKNLKLGVSEAILSGNDISIITIGNTVYKGIKLAEKLKENNISCDVINARFLKPFDNKNILESITKCKRVIVIEDSTEIGGLSWTVKSLICDHNLNNIKIKCYSYPDKFIEHGSVKDLEKKYKLDIDSIYQDIINCFEISTK